MSKKSLIAILIAVAVSIPTGLGTYTFIYGRGHSYFVDDPKVCINCHIMKDQYDSWQKSPHRAVATCNSCHTPKGLVHKLFVKGVNGFNHSRAFTTQNFSWPIKIKKFNLDIAENACKNCHGDLLAATGHHEMKNIQCTYCHKGIGHSVWCSVNLPEKSPGTFSGKKNLVLMG